MRERIGKKMDAQREREREKSEFFLTKRKHKEQLNRDEEYNN